MSGPIATIAWSASQVICYNPNSRTLPDCNASWSCPSTEDEGESPAVQQREPARLCPYERPSPLTRCSSNAACRDRSHSATGRRAPRAFGPFGREFRHGEGSNVGPAPAPNAARQDGLGVAGWPTRPSLSPPTDASTSPARVLAAPLRHAPPSRHVAHPHRSDRPHASPSRAHVTEPIAGSRVNPPRGRRIRASQPEREAPLRDPGGASFKPTSGRIRQSGWNAYAQHVA